LDIAATIGPDIDLISGIVGPRSKDDPLSSQDDVYEILEEDYGSSGHPARALFLSFFL